MLFRTLFGRPIRPTIPIHIRSVSPRNGKVTQIARPQKTAAPSGCKRDPASERVNRASSPRVPGWLHVPDAFTIRIVHIRPYQAADAAAMVALKRETIRRVNRRDYSPEQVAAWAPDDRAMSQWPDRLVGRFIVIAEEAGQIIGFGDVGLDGHIDQCFVHADHQRRGVGRSILAALLSEARRRGLARLTSDVSITARPFFEAQGFVVDAEQTVHVKGMAFVNFRMSRQMSARDAD